MSQVQIYEILAQENSGMGIRNVRKQVKLMYGEEAELHIESQKEEERS